jgi:hypothetical protein
MKVSIRMIPIHQPPSMCYLMGMILILHINDVIVGDVFVASSEAGEVESQ